MPYAARFQFEKGEPILRLLGQHLRAVLQSRHHQAFCRCGIVAESFPNGSDCCAFDYHSVRRMVDRADDIRKVDEDVHRAHPAQLLLRFQVLELMLHGGELLSHRRERKVKTVVCDRWAMKKPAAWASRPRISGWSLIVVLPMGVESPCSHFRGAAWWQKKVVDNAHIMA